MSCEEDGDESEYNPDQDEESSSDESSDESGDKPSDREVVRGDSDGRIMEEESANTSMKKSDQKLSHSLLFGLAVHVHYTIFYTNMYMQLI